MVEHEASTKHKRVHQDVLTPPLSHVQKRMKRVIQDEGMGSCSDEVMHGVDDVMEEYSSQISIVNEQDVEDDVFEERGGGQHEVASTFSDRIKVCACVPCMD